MNDVENVAMEYIKELNDTNKKVRDLLFNKIITITIVDDMEYLFDDMKKMVISFNDGIHQTFNSLIYFEDEHCYVEDVFKHHIFRCLMLYYNHLYLSRGRKDDYGNLPLFEDGLKNHNGKINTNIILNKKMSNRDE